MCVGYGMIGHANPGGRELEKPKKAGKAAPSDRVNNQEVGSQTDRQALSDRAQADQASQKQEINWRERNPSRDDPQNIRFERLKSAGATKGKAGNKEFIDDDRHMLKLNPDGTAALGMGADYYKDLDNWYSKSDLEEMGFYGSSNNDGVNL